MVEAKRKQKILIADDSEMNRSILADMLEDEYEIMEAENGVQAVAAIEKDGVDLSGGQWQKLAIARLLYSEAPINILDEPTAALDPKGEAKVYEMFWQVTMEGERSKEEGISKEEAHSMEKFTILITHRLGAARMADEILVLDQGKIVEQGTHKALIGLENGLYKEMFDNQRCWYEA